MAIRLDKERTDEQGLPVVTWEEDRNLFAPGGLSPARVACFIRPNDKGELQFVSVGSVRHGEFEEARPWEKLVSFGMGTADQHYRSAGERALLDMLAGKSKRGVGRVLATDGAHVVLAHFADDRPSIAMHLNCAEASPVEVALLHDRLSREFVRRRDAEFRQIYGRDMIWPKDGPSFKAYTPPALASVPWWMNRLADITVIAVLGLMGWGFYWFLLR
ncbi:MAG: hypothetical protein ACLP7P_09730 [Rhodomicrobium sp.]